VNTLLSDEMHLETIIVNLSTNMPKEVKPKGERKKRAKKGRTTTQFKINNALTILLIDPNAPKRGLSAYMFFAQVSFPPTAIADIPHS
jgi:hypothetical protein